MNRIGRCQSIYLAEGMIDSIHKTLFKNVLDTSYGQKYTLRKVAGKN